MTTVSIQEIFWLMIATAGTSGLLIILSALVTGWLVYRTKREQHEGLFVKPEKHVHKPIVVDEFASVDDESTLPPAVRKLNERFNVLSSVQGLKREKVNG